MNDIRYGRAFEAKYYGYCSDCGRDIKPGSMVRYRHIGAVRSVVCADCDRHEAADITEK